MDTYDNQSSMSGSISGAGSTITGAGSSVESVITDPVSRFSNQPLNPQGPMMTRFFDTVADVGFAARTNPQTAFVIGVVLSFLIIVVIGGLACAGFNFFKPSYLSKASSCMGKLLIGGILASLVVGVGFWFRASLLQGNRRKLEREGFADKSYQTALLLPSLITSQPL